MSFSLGHDAEHAQIVFATGKIGSDTAAKFEQFVFLNRLKAGATISLDSPGGDDLVDATALGRAIRGHYLRTSVGRPVPQGSESHPRLLSDPDPGVCAGSCTLAFLGGTFREVPNGSFLDIYQTYTSLKHSHLNFDKGTFVAQKWSALFASYLREMSIDEVFYEYATQGMATAKSRTHYIPDAGELHAWNVTRSDHATHWELQIRDRHFALVGANPPEPFLVDLQSGTPNPASASGQAPSKGRLNEIVFACAPSHAHVMEIGYRPPSDLSQSAVTRYELSRRFSGEAAEYQRVGKQPAGQLPIKPEWVVTSFKALPSGEVRGQIMLTPELREMLQQTDVLSLDLYSDQGWPARLEADFSPGSDLLREFIKVPCS
jgi:hypothetical protein